MSDGSNQGDAGPEPRVSLFGRRAKVRSPSESLQPQTAPPPPAPPPRKRRHDGLSLLSALLSFILVCAFAGAAAFVWVVIAAQKPGPLAADTVVLIKDDPNSTIPEQLAHAGVIDSPHLFTATVWLDGAHSALKRGEYLFKEHVSMRDVEGVLISGKVVQHRVTVPPGLTSALVVQLLRDNDVFAGEIKESPAEGSILPDSYDFPRGESRASIIKRMQKAQEKAVDEIWRKRAPDLPIKSPGELITLASIVEKETGKADERPRVARVFINRLQKRMKLESDPTIVYGLVHGKGTLGHSISRSELIQPTPYNTYMIEGLPPGPITNPGKASLEAVANPAAGQELFFVADGSGGHAFAETLDQHQKNVIRWRQIEKDAKDRLAPDAGPLVPAGPPAPAKVHGALDPVDPKAFGGLARPVAAAKSPAEAIAFAKRLMKVGAERQTREAVLSPNGSLAGAGRNLAEMGVVVEGVNDSASSEALDVDPGAPPLQTTTPSPSGLQGASKIVASAEFATPAGPRPRAFDASEGTPLDPLLNKTYDLNFPKEVPKLK